MESFLLCDSSEIPLDGALSIGDGEQIEFKDCKLDSGAAAPPMLKVYLRSDVRDFPEEPQIRIIRGKFTGDEDEDAWLRLDGKVKQKQAHLRVKPLIRYWQPAYDTRTQMNQDPQGHVTVRMDRPPELKGIHICIDFGMSNTAVAVYAPGLEMPVGDPSVEVLALPSWQESLSEQIASLLPSPPITLEKALSGIENIHRHFGYRRDLDGIAAFLRGTYLLAHYIERSKSTDKTDPLSAFKDISRTLKERGGPDLSPPELSDEAIATQDLLKFDSQLPQALAEHGIGVNLETIEERLTAFFEGQQEGEAPERQERLLPDGDEMENPSDDALNGKEETDAGEDDAETLGHGGDEESAPVGANGAESGTAHEAVQPEKTGAEDSGDKEAQQDDETKQVKEDQQEESEPTPNEDTSTADITMPTPSGSQPSSNGTASSDNHWTFGMAQWMEGLVDQVSNPLIRQNAQTQSAIKETQELVERTGKTLAELAQGVEAALDELKDGAQLTLPEEAKATLDSIDKSLKTLVNRVPKADEDEEDEDNPSVYSARDAKNRAFDKVEDKKHPVFYFAKEDKSLTDFEDFVEGEGFFYPPSIYRKVWGHLHTENTRLIILAGAPGAGKSTLARLLAEFFNADVDVETFEDEKPGWQAFWHMEAVSPSWFSPESLLGGKGPINGIVQPSAFSEFLMSAEAHHAKAELTEKPSRMFFGCLDEFNIARPEQYMASLLSKLEAPITTGGGSQRTIRFSEGKHGVSIELTPNLKLFATINTDAASKVLSPKVLDRAFFIRMTPTLENLKTVATKLKKKHLVSEFHDVFTKVLPDLDQLARAGQSPLGYRAMAKSYQYASSLKDSDVEVKTVVCDAVESVFLSKLPGAFSVNDPKQNYIGHLKDETSSLRTVIDVSSTLDVIANGLPGQASI